MSDTRVPEPYWPIPTPPEGPPPPPPPFAVRRPSQALAITAFVLAIAALLVSWIPFVCFLAGLAAVTAVVLAIVTLVGVRRRSLGGKGFAIAALPVAGVAIVVSAVAGLATLSGGWSAFMGEGREISVTEQRVIEQAEALPLGTAAQVGDYSVAVTSVTLDADDELAIGQNPEPIHQYVLVELRVSYEGVGGGDPYQDLMAVFAGANGRVYDELTCDAAPLEDGAEVGPLTSGASATYEVCMDVPRTAKAGAKIYVEDYTVSQGERVYWATE